MSSIIVPGGPMGDKWTQQVHQGCGGEIVIVVTKGVSDRKLAAVCKGCRDMWMMPQISGFPDNWSDPGNFRGKSPLIVPASGRVN